MNPLIFIIGYPLGFLITFALFVFNLDAPRDHGRILGFCVIWPFMAVSLVISGLLKGLRVAWRWCFVRQRSNGL